MKKLLSKLPSLESIKAKVSKAVIAAICAVHNLVLSILDLTIFKAIKPTEDSVVLIDPVAVPNVRKPATRRKRVKKKVVRRSEKKKTNRKK